MINWKEFFEYPLGPPKYFPELDDDLLLFLLHQIGEIHTSAGPCICDDGRLYGRLKASNS